MAGSVEGDNANLTSMNMFHLVATSAPPDRDILCAGGGAAAGNAALRGVKTQNRNSICRK